MSNWTKVILHKEGSVVKIYYNADNTRAVMFPLFGRYFSFSSDVSAIDLAVQILFHQYVEDWTIPNIATYRGYLNSQEDTAIIIQEAA